MTEETEQLKREVRRLVIALEEIVDFVDLLGKHNRDTSSANHCASIADDALNTYYHGRRSTT